MLAFLWYRGECPGGIFPYNLDGKTLDVHAVEGLPGGIMAVDVATAARVVGRHPDGCFRAATPDEIATVAMAAARVSLPAPFAPPPREAPISEQPNDALWAKISEPNMTMDKLRKLARQHHVTVDETAGRAGARRALYDAIKNPRPHPAIATANQSPPPEYEEVELPAPPVRPTQEQIWLASGPEMLRYLKAYFDVVLPQRANEAEIREAVEFQIANHFPARAPMDFSAGDDGGDPEDFGDDDDINDEDPPEDLVAAEAARIAANRPPDAPEPEGWYPKFRKDLTTANNAELVDWLGRNGIPTEGVKRPQLLAAASDLYARLQEIQGAA